MLIIACAAITVGAERVALVIGNGAYVQGDRLANPANDAADIAAALTQCGFSLVGGQAWTDLDHESMDRRLIEFRQAAGGAQVALFFFSGHGIEVGGENYLIPVDADFKEEYQVKHRALALGEALESMVGNDRLKIVILDCCRDNPLGRSWSRSGTVGLVAPTGAPEGTFLFFATAPGKVATDGSGRNSPFSGVLKTVLLRPGKDLEDVFREVGSKVATMTEGKQRPWRNSDYYGKFCFVQEKSDRANSKPITSTVSVPNPLPKLPPAVINDSVIPLQMNTPIFSLPQPPVAKARELQSHISVSISYPNPLPESPPQIKTGIPLEQYKKELTQALERVWHRYREKNAQFVSYGTLTVKFCVDRNGIPRKLKLIKNNANAVMAEFTLRAVLDADIPKMPDDVALFLGDAGLEICYDVVVY